MSKKGLGRGLQALLPDEIGDDPGIKEIPVTIIDPNPEQPRTEFEPQALNDLADSLRLHGLLQPILVRPAGERYFVIAGERRLRAAKIAGLTAIKCIVQVCSDQEMAERALIENIQRADLSPVEEGLAYERLINEYGLSQEQVAQRVGKARTTVTNLLRVIQLPEAVLDLLRNNLISLGHAKVLLGVKDTSLQVLTAQKAAKEQLSVRDTENLINRLTERVEKDKPAPERYPLLHNVQDKLRTSFQTKVIVKGDYKRGRIEVQYFSEDELNRLLELWNIKIE
ncbi:ParB/RepB/Spo0J family partition protein [Desulfosporosinus nitroreducens]|uniref:ParB/RepB/Spo0J family partition protein n=1 Tax=Desulfosporosinus nitroreducens TaxID=2018668 RepID=A0ABT8QRM9_9FIRM|nr:ParB/RepB/Spo0J family partition protein [Desulfosporosinus nitroreducens]MCO1601426.1 ParB/RepB/Spo0J family partition protein [Desulfosporosinus nitroreducens]MDO0824006.1 ParB/RepB/Spo0J family partition protein [Desulfosporosinus nitroreducens]